MAVRETKRYCFIACVKSMERIFLSRELTLLNDDIILFLVSNFGSELSMFFGREFHAIPPCVNELRPKPNEMNIAVRMF